MVRNDGASFRKLYTAAVGTRFGDSARTSAVAVLGAQLTSSPAVLSLVSAMSFAPWLLFGLPAGALIDRVDKRRAFLLADGIRCAASALLVLLVFSGQLSILVLIVFVFTLTTLQTISDSCFNSLVPAVVPAEDLGPANGRLSASQSTAGVFGPPAGSYLASLGASFPFLLNVVTFGAAAALVTSLPADIDRKPGSRPAPAAPGVGVLRSLGRDILDGVQGVRGKGLLSVLLACVTVSNLCNGLNSGVLPLLAIREVGVSPAHYGFVVAANAACMVLGNVAAGLLLSHEFRHRTVAGAAIALKLPGFALVCSAHSFAVLMAGMAVLGAASGLWNVPSSSLLMSSASKETIGRTMALFRTVAVAGMPLGAVLSGLLAGAAGLRAGALAAALLSGLTFVYFVHRSRRSPGAVDEPEQASLPGTAGKGVKP